REHQFGYSVSPAEQRRRHRGGRPPPPQRAGRGALTVWIAHRVGRAQALLATAARSVASRRDHEAASRAFRECGASGSLACAGPTRAVASRAKQEQDLGLARSCRPGSEGAIASRAIEDAVKLGAA